MKRSVGILLLFLAVAGAFWGGAIHKATIFGRGMDRKIEISADHHTADYEKAFRARYAEINRLPLTGVDGDVTYYTLNQDEWTFTTSRHSVVYRNVSNGGFEVGALFNDDSSLVTQKARLFIRSGFSSVPDRTLEEQYDDIVSLLHLSMNSQDGIPSYKEFEANISLTGNFDGGKRYEYVPNDVMRFIVEESVCDGVVNGRTLFCDIN